MLVSNRVPLGHYFAYLFSTAAHHLPWLHSKAFKAVAANEAWSFFKWNILFKIVFHVCVLQPRAKMWLIQPTERSKQRLPLPWGGGGGVAFKKSTERSMYYRFPSYTLLQFKRGIWLLLIVLVGPVPTKSTCVNQKPNICFLVMF